MAISQYNETVTISRNWQAANVRAGLPDGGPAGHNLSASYTFGTRAANNLHTGADCKFLDMAQIAPGKTLLLDLTGLPDFVTGRPTRWARVKFARLKLLGAKEVAPDGRTPGTACKRVTVGRAPEAQCRLFLAGNTDAAELDGGEYGDEITWVSPGPLGRVVTGASKHVLVTNNDPGEPALIYIELIGGGD